MDRVLMSFMNKKLVNNIINVRSVYLSTGPRIFFSVVLSHALLVLLDNLPPKTYELTFNRTFPNGRSYDHHDHIVLYLGRYNPPKVV